MTHVCLFEDDGWRGLLPITWLHPCWELVVGTRDTLARVRESFPDASLHALCRPWIERVAEERSGVVAARRSRPSELFLSGRLVDVEYAAHHARQVSGSFSLWNGETVVAFRLDRPGVELPGPDELTDWVRGLDLPSIHCDARVFRRWWDLVYLNGQVLRDDLRRFTLGVYEGTIMSGSHLLDPGTVFLGPYAQIEPGVILDSRDGGIVLDRGVKVGANAMIVGPVYLGRDSLVKPLSHIGPEVSAGPSCRLGGEIARSIFQGYANKQHHGFLGHAYVGCWANLGAGTTNSNLKNTYGHVSVWVDGEMEDSGLTFVGCAIADHAKTAINTVLNTGTVIGVSANVFSRGFPPKFVPSFSWGPEPGHAYQLHSALSTASRVLERRGMALTEAESALLSVVWEQTAPERFAEGGEREGWPEAPGRACS